jgi:hypothetical protein
MKRVLINTLLLAVAAGCSGEAPAEPAPDAEVAATSLPAKTSVAADKGSAALGPPAPRPAEDSEQFATVRRYTAMFYRGELEQLFENFSDEMREVVPREQLSAIHEHAVTNFGQETSVIAEDSAVKNDYRGFVRWARFDKTDAIIEIQWILRPNDEIAGFFIRPAQKEIRGEAGPEIEPQPQ